MRRSWKDIASKRTYGSSSALGAPAACSVRRPDNLQWTLGNRLSSAMWACQGSISPNAIRGFAPWSMTIGNVGHRRASSIRTGRWRGCIRASKRKPCWSIACNAGSSSLPSSHCVSSIACSIGRRPRNLGRRASSVIRAGAKGDARSTQPTTPATRGSSAAISRSQSVSRSSGCDCTRTMPCTTVDAGSPDDSEAVASSSSAGPKSR